MLASRTINGSDTEVDIPLLDGKNLISAPSILNSFPFMENEPFVILYSPSIPTSPLVYSIRESPFIVPFIFLITLALGILTFTLSPACTFTSTIYCFNILSTASSIIPSTIDLSCSSFTCCFEFSSEFDELKSGISRI